MSEFIPGSISNVYKDIDGNDCSLFHLVNESPEWACSRIREGEKAAAELAELQAKYDELQEALQEIADSDHSYSWARLKARAALKEQAGGQH